MPTADVPDPSPRVARRALAAAVVAALAAVPLVACGSARPTARAGAEMDPVTTTTTAIAATAEPVVKDVLAEDTTPPGAPGYTLTLMRYTIAPGAQLAPHVHPGVQMAAIDRGTLRYTVVSGTAQVRRGGGPATAVTGPTQITLDQGDSVVEPFDMVHFGANDTDQPVVITATLLTRSDQGLSVAVSTTTTAAP
jgi:quercetin dioxygenase-like cupin family protein